MECRPALRRLLSSSAYGWPQILFGLAWFVEAQNREDGAVIGWAEAAGVRVEPANAEVRWAGENSTLLYQHNVSAGTLRAVGPFLGAWRCVAGRRCAVVDLRGEGLGPQDRLAARSAPCGAFDADLGNGRRFNGSSDRNVAVTVFFAQPVRARYLRLYPTKWFGHVALRAAPIVQACPGCAASTEVDVPAGLRSASSEMPPRGPADCFSAGCGLLGSAFGWVAGTAQQGEWYQMDTGSRLYITGVALAGRGDAEQWVEEFMVSYSGDGKAWVRIREARSAEGFPNSGQAVGRFVLGSGEFEWPGPIAAQGGEYSLCWLPAGAVQQALEDFVTSAGSLVLDGPFHGQAFTCNAGRPCRVTGLQGVGLHYGDSARPLPQCGITDPSAPVATAEDAAGQDFDWGSSAAALKPMQYAFCWCRPWTVHRGSPEWLGRSDRKRTQSHEGNASSTTTASSMADEAQSSDSWRSGSSIVSMSPEATLGEAACEEGGVFINAGVLVIVGPRQGTFRCNAGATCAVTPLDGEGLSDGDRLMIALAETPCGTGMAEPVPGVPNKGISEGADVRGTRYQWLSEPILSQGGIYRLCWCSASLYNCSQPSDFSVAAGRLELFGPYYGQTRTCLGGLECVLANIVGVGLAPQDEVEVRLSCMHRASPGFPGPAIRDAAGFFRWAMAITATGGNYRMCWRAAGDSGDSGADAGELVVLGPAAAHRRVAVASMRLQVPMFTGASVVGTGGMASSTASRTGDRVLVARMCDGSEDNLVPGIPGPKGVSQKLAPAASQYDWGTELVTAQGGDYRLCWCSGQHLNGTPRGCSDILDFIVDAGTLSVSGPAGGQYWSCAASRPCKVQGVMGFGFTALDRVLVKTGDCTGGVPVVGLHWASVVNGTLVNAEGNVASFDWGAAVVGAQGGHYAICWCTERSWAVGVGQDPCESPYPYRFATEVGSLMVKGPDPTHSSWVREFGGSGNDFPTRIVVDTTEPEEGLGHTVLAGTTDGTIENPQTALMRGRAEGLQWAEGRDPKQDLVTVPCRYMRPDSGYIVYTTECTYPRLSLQAMYLRNFGGTDGWVAKIGYNASQLWTRQIGSVNGGNDSIAGLGIHPATANLAIGGTTDGNFIPGAPISKDTRRPESMSGGTDCWVMTLDQFGEITGAFQFGSYEKDWLSAVVVDYLGGIFVTVTRGDVMVRYAPEGGLDSMILKFSPDLRYLWSGLVGALGDDVFTTAQLWYDPACVNTCESRIITGGYTTGQLYARNRGKEDVFVNMFGGGDVDVALQFSHQYGSDGSDIITTIAVGSDGSIYIGGYTDGNLFMSLGLWSPYDEPATNNPMPGGIDGFVMKLTDDLRFPVLRGIPTEGTWLRMLGTPRTERIWSMTFLAGETNVGGDLLVSGTTESPWPEAASAADSLRGARKGYLGQDDAWLMTLSPDGRISGWEKQLRSPGNQTIYAMAAEGAGGHVYAAGKTRGGGGFQPEVGATQLVDYGGDDVVVLKIVWNRAAGRCFRGGTCEADVVSGIGLDATDQAILAVTRCGLAVDAASGVPHETSDGMAVADPDANDTSGLRQSFRWGNKAEGRLLLAPEGRYVLCWCAGGCQGAVPQEVSVVFIIGPSPDQTKSCVVGEPCDITGITGRDINAWDKIAVMPAPCGREFAPGFPDATGSVTSGIVLFKAANPQDTSCMRVVAEEMGGVDSNWGCRRINVDAGTYRLCFCTPREGEAALCESAVEFAFDIGQLRLYGPYKNQSRKCAWGQRCEITGIKGYGLQDGDSLLILDACRTPQLLPIGGLMSIRGIIGLTREAPVAAYSQVSDFFGRFQNMLPGSVFLVADPVTALAGKYKMCWCRPSASARSCSFTDDFALDMGDLTVEVLAMPYLRKCHRGERCTVRFPEFADGDVVHVLTACPGMPKTGRFRYDVPYDGTEDSYRIPGWPRGGLSFPAEAGGRISWGPEAVWVDVGRYLMCWCMGAGVWPLHKRCEKPQDFWIPIGQLEIDGPLPGQSHYSAVAGQPVVISNLTGFGLEDGDGLAVVPLGESCEGILNTTLNASSWSGFPQRSILTQTMEPFFTRSPSIMMNYSTEFSGGASPVVQNGGLFTLCVVPAQSGRRSPTGGTFGEYVFVGCGTELEARSTCGPRGLPMPKTESAQRYLEAAIAQAHAAGAIVAESCGKAIWLGGRWDETFLRWKWDDAVDITDGPVVGSSGSALASDTQPFTNWDVGEPSGEPPRDEPWMYMSIAGGKWRDSHGGYSFTITCQASQPLLVGVLRLEGPRAGQRFVALAGKPLAVVGLAGVGLRMGDFLAAIRAGERCGSVPAVAALGGEGLSRPSLDGANFSWPGAALTQGDVYGLCWCRKAEGVTACRHAADFVVPAGELLLEGPMLGQQFKCGAGERCVINLTWPSLVPVVPGLLFAKPGEHGDVASDFPGGPATGQEVFEWPRVATTGGLRALYWCPAPPSGAAWAAHASDADDCSHRVGSLELQGPLPGHRFTCIAGRACAAGPLRGHGLVDGYRLLFTARASCDEEVDSGGALAVKDIISLPAGHCSSYFTGCTSLWPADLMGVAASDYRLCWCGHGPCALSGDFVVDVGRLRVLNGSAALVAYGVGTSPGFA